MRTPISATHDALNIRHLTDVSHCKLHEYLCCNREIKCQKDLPRGLAAQGDMALPGPAHTSLVRKQMDTMAPTRPTELHESTSPADLPEPTSPAKLRLQACPAGLQKPIRPTALQKRCVSLTAGPTAPGIARGQVRATIAAWDVPVDTSIAILLTSELVTNAVMHEAGETINLVITCGYGQFGVDVHDTSCELPVPVDGPPDAETGRGLVLVASLSSSWGYYRTPKGKAVYFTLAFASDSGEEDKREA
jgi:hypothetical protein